MTNQLIKDQMLDAIAKYNQIEADVKETKRKNTELQQQKQKSEFIEWFSTCLSDAVLTYLNCEIKFGRPHKNNDVYAAFTLIDEYEKPWEICIYKNHINDPLLYLPLLDVAPRNRNDSWNSFSAYPGMTFEETLLCYLHDWETKRLKLKQKLAQKAAQQAEAQRLAAEAKEKQDAELLVKQKAKQQQQQQWAEDIAHKEPIAKQQTDEIKIHIDNSLVLQKNAIVYLWRWCIGAVPYYDESYVDYETEYSFQSELEDGWLHTISGRKLRPTPLCTVEELNLDFNLACAYHSRLIKETKIKLLGVKRINDFLVYSPDDFTWISVNNFKFDSFAFPNELSIPMPNTYDDVKELEALYQNSDCDTPF